MSWRPPISTAPVRSAAALHHPAGAASPTFLFVTVIALLNAVTQVDHVFVMTKGGPSNSTNLVLFYIYQQAVEHYDIGKASAATLLTLAVLMGLTALSLPHAWQTARADA